MLMSDIAKARWNGRTRKWFEDKGYVWTKQGDFFCCNIADLTKESTAKVVVKCDYCGEITDKQFRNYKRERKIIPKDCCSNRQCMVQKSREVNLKTIGVENNSQLQSSRDRMGELYRVPFEEVVSLCKEKGLTLLSTKKEYKSDRTRLQVICKNHESEGIQETNFANLKLLKGCCYYQKFELTANGNRTEGEDVFNDFINAGLYPKFKPEDYVNTVTSLPYICSKHEDKGIQYKSYTNLKFSSDCPFCAYIKIGEALMLDENFVFNQLKEKGIIPIEGEKYTGKDHHIQYRCLNHPNEIQYTSYSSFKRSEQCCKYCRDEESVTKLNRTLRSSINKWKKDSILACDGKCILSGLENYEVHHIYTFNNIILDVLKNLNIEIKTNYDGYEIEKIKKLVKQIHNDNLGICLHPTLHILYHQLYSKANNTKEQFNEFKNRYCSGEFNDKLEDKLKYKTI